MLKRLGSAWFRYKYDFPTRKIGLKLTLNTPSRSNAKTGDPLIDKLLSIRPDQIWVFLSTHGMWLEEVRDDGEVSLLIDCFTGFRRLITHHENHELISAILLTPIFDQYVEEVSYTKKVKQVEEQLIITSRGVHSKVKKGEILYTDVVCGKWLEVTPLTFHAATSGYHRLGYSIRLGALQSAFSRMLAEYFFGEESSIRTYSEMFGLRQESEIAGALASYLSILIRYSTDINLEAIQAEMTTSIFRFEKICREKIVKSSRNLLYYISEELEDLEIDFERSSDSFLLRLPDKKVDKDFSRIQVGLNPFGRLNYLKSLKKSAVEWASKDVRMLVLDFSEQMNPSDLYLLSLLIENCSFKLDSTWIICTPLTYPIASVTSAYATQLPSLGRIRIVMSSEDPLVAKVLAESLSKKIEDGKMLYLAAGPTTHVLSFGKTLKNNLGDNVIFEALTP